MPLIHLSRMEFPTFINWASTRQNQSSEVREQQRCRQDCASAQTNQSLQFVGVMNSVAEETGLRPAF